MAAHPLEKKVRRFRRRLLGIETLHRILQCLLVVSLCVLFLKLLERLFDTPVNVWLVAQTLAATALVIGILWGILKRPTVLYTAMAVDDRLKLRERISSGLCMIESQEDEIEIGSAKELRSRLMKEAVVEDAQQHAANLHVGEVFPYPFFRELRWLTLVVAIIAGVHFFVPPMQLLASNSKKNAGATSQPLPAEQAKKLAEELKQMKQSLAQRTETKDPLQLGELEKNLEELQKELEFKKITKPEAIAKASKLSDKIQAKKEGLEDKMKDFESLKPTGNEKFTKDVQKDMENGNFKQAEAKLEDLKKQAESGKMTEQDKKQMAQELQKLGEQMKENPELAKALSEAAKQMNKGDMQKMSEQMAMAQGELSELAEALEQMKELDQLAEKAGDSKTAMTGKIPGQSQGEGKGDGEWKNTDALSKDWKAGEEMKKGSGMGGPGQGMGGTARMELDSVKMDKQQVKGELQKGRILSQIKVEGPQVKGDSNVTFEQAYVEAEQAAEDTMDREPMPKEYTNLVKDYFDAIKPQTQAKTAAPAATPAK